MAILVLSAAPPILASKRRAAPSRRKSKSKRVAFPLPRLRLRVPFKRAFSSLLSSLASSPLASQLPPPLDLLPPLINGSRRGTGLGGGAPLWVLLSAGSASVVGFNLKEIARMKVRVVVPRTGNTAAAAYFLLGFVLCFLICKAAIFEPRKRSGWRF